MAKRRTNQDFANTDEEFRRVCMAIDPKLMTPRQASKWRRKQGEIWLRRKEAKK